MSYKTTLLKETKEIIKNIKNEIQEIIKINENILAFKNLNKFDLGIVEKNLKKIEQKENEIKYYNEQLQEILKMDNAA